MSRGRRMKCSWPALATQQAGCQLGYETLSQEHTNKSKPPKQKTKIFPVWWFECEAGRSSPGASPLCTVPARLQSTHLMTGPVSLDTQWLHRKYVHVEIHEPGVLSHASNHSTLKAAAERPPQGRGQLGLQRALDKLGLRSEFWTSPGYRASSRSTGLLSKFQIRIGYGRSELVNK